MSVDSVSRHTLLTVFVLSLAFFSISNAYTSKIVDHWPESPAIAENMLGISNRRHIEVYLPDGYEEGNQRYPALYFIPGWTDLAYGRIIRYYLDTAIRSAKIPPTIVVFIDVPEGTMFLNSPVFGNWEDFMISELIPFIDREYRTIPDPLARGLIGFSAGGYSAMMLPTLHPGIWGSIGGIDPALYFMWIFIRSIDIEFAMSSVRELPRDLDEYNPLYSIRAGIMLNLGTVISPNPEAPLFCDFPITPDGQWIPEIREKWIAYDISDPETLAKHSETLKDLLCVVIIIPMNMEEYGVVYERKWYPPFFEQLQSAGIEVTQLDMPGGHNYQDGERFIAIAEQILGAMIGAEVSVSPRGKATALWGEIRQGR